MTEPRRASQSKGKKGLSVAIIGPDEQWRAAVVEVLGARRNVHCHEFAAFDPDPGRFAASVVPKFDAAFLDVDSNPEYMFHLAEGLCSDSNFYVMACSSETDVRFAIRFMRIGVREFFTSPVDPDEVMAALERAAGHNAAAASAPVGKLFVFIGAKGGVGVTTVAANFGLTLAQETEKNTLIIDFGLPLGDVAINLGMRTQYSIMNALLDPDRLDGGFLESIVTKHESGLNVLGAPAEFPDTQPTAEAIDKLLEVARTQYDFVVVDAGSRIDLFDTTLFEQSTTIYLVTQVGISELRNAHRMITQFFAARGRSLQIVLNRYTQRALLFDDAQVEKTLTRATDWKLPDDYAAARRTRNTATPLSLIETQLADSIRELARNAAEIQVETPKKGFFRLLR